MHANMPAIEIAFGETSRAASHTVAACAHFRLRVAIGRRSIVVSDVSCMTGCTVPIAGRRAKGQDKIQQTRDADNPVCAITVWSPAFRRRPRHGSFGPRKRGTPSIARELAVSAPRLQTRLP